MSKQIDDIIRLLELNEITLWTVSSGDGDNKRVFDSLDDETLATRQDRFRRVMELYPAGRLILIGSRSKNDTRGKFRYEFENRREDATAISGVQSVQPSVGLSKDEVKDQIAAAIEEHDRKRRLEELEKENKELQKELRDISNSGIGLIHRAQPILNQIIDRYIPKPATIQVAGIENNNNAEPVVFESIGEVDEETTARAQAAIEMWAEADPDFLKVLEFIADFAANEKSINVGLGMTLDYPKIKEMLLNK